MQTQSSQHSPKSTEPKDKPNTKKTKTKKSKGRPSNNQKAIEKPTNKQQHPKMLEKCFWHTSHSIENLLFLACLVCSMVFLLCLDGLPLD
jgi:hypothetical protein